MLHLDNGKACEVDWTKVTFQSLVSLSIRSAVNELQLNAESSLTKAAVTDGMCRESDNFNIRWLPWLHSLKPDPVWMRTAFDSVLRCLYGQVCGCVQRGSRGALIHPQQQSGLRHNSVRKYADSKHIESFCYTFITTSKHIKYIFLYTCVNQKCRSTVTIESSLVSAISLCQLKTQVQT